MPAMIQKQWFLSGRGEDPYVGLNSADYVWMEDRAWWLRRTITAAELIDARSGMRARTARLLFDGIDHDAVVYLNDIEAASHRGAFGGPVVPLPTTGSDITVTVRIDPRGTGKGREANSPGSLVKGETMSKWINNPDLMTAGIWRRVRLILTDEWTVERPFVETLQLPTTAEQGESHAAAESAAALVRVSFEVLHSDAIATVDSVQRYGPIPPLDDPANSIMAATPAMVRVIVRDPDGEVAASELVPVARNRAREWYDLTMRLESPQLWTIHTVGAAKRYSVELELLVANTPIDSVVTRFGLRSFSLDRSTARRVTDRRSNLVPVLNGTPRRLHGMNWMPLDLLQVTPERYRWFLTLAHDLGVELIRVWGGGVIEDDVFYDICDELGLLVWQDFPYNTFWEGEGADLTVWEQQAIWTVQRLRNHPSLVVWCGGNEFDPYHPSNAGVIGILERTVTDFDGTRPWVRASPDGGDVHPYPECDTTWYLPLFGEAPAVSEWGGHAPPSLHTLESFLPAVELDRPLGLTELADDDDFAVTHPNLRHHWAEFRPERIKRMLQRGQVHGSLTESNLGQFVDAVQHGAAEIYETAVKDFRSFAPDMWLYLPWVYNRPWPSVGMQVVDHGGRPSIGYYALKRGFSQRYVGITVANEVVFPGETIEVRIGTNAGSHGSAEVILRLFGSDLAEINRWVVPAVVTQAAGADPVSSASQMAGDITATVPRSEPAGIFLVADLVCTTGTALSRSVRWLRSSAAHSDRRTRDAYRAEPQASWLTDTVPSADAVGAGAQATTLSAVASRFTETEFGLTVTVIVTNVGAVAAVSARIEVDSADWIAVADQNYFWLDSGESATVELTVQSAASIGLGSLHAGVRPEDEPRFVVGAWNAPTLPVGPALH